MIKTYHQLVIDGLKISVTRAGEFLIKDKIKRERELAECNESFLIFAVFNEKFSLV